MPNKVTGKLGTHCSFRSSETKKGDTVYLEADVAELREEHDRLQNQLTEASNESLLLRTLADIREVTGVGGKPMLSELAESIKAENEQLRKDAERYRWLRDYSATFEYLRESDIGYINLDNQVDKAMSDNTLKPSREGSKMCESGSIASGGKKEYCTCDYCF